MRDPSEEAPGNEQGTRSSGPPPESRGPSGQQIKEPLRRRLRASGLEGLTRAARLLPTPLVRTGLQGLAGLTRFGPVQRRVLANLELALGTTTSAQERLRIAQGVRRHSARLAEEWLRLASGGARDEKKRRWILRTVQFDSSLGLLEEELERGRGALILTAHIGNWELLAAALRIRGLDGVVVGRKRPNDSSSDWLVRMRRSYGVTTVFQDDSPRSILRVLRDGQTVGMLADLEVRRLAGEFLPFFGVPALTMTAPAALARAGATPLIPISCVATSAEHYLLHVEEPLYPDPALGRSAGTLELTSRLNRCFEDWIRARPEQWAWHQPRWRTRPGKYEARPLSARLSAHRALADDRAGSHAQQSLSAATESEG